MVEEQIEQELESAVERQHYARAAALAEGLGLDQKRVTDLREKAIWQMTAVYRNMQGTRLLAEQYGLSMKDVEVMLRSLAKAKEETPRDRALEPCYDHGTGRYLSFEEWLEALLKHWDRLSS